MHVYIFIFYIKRCCLKNVKPKGKKMIIQKPITGQAAGSLVFY